MDSLEKLATALVDHTHDDREQFQSIHDQLVVIKDNHLFHMQESMATIVIEMREIKSSLSENTLETADTRSNIGWVMKIGGAVGIVLLVAVITLLFKVISRGI